MLLITLGRNPLSWLTTSWYVTHTARPSHFLHRDSFRFRFNSSLNLRFLLRFWSQDKVWLLLLNNSDLFFRNNDFFFVIYQITGCGNLSIDLDLFRGAIGCIDIYLNAYFWHLERNILNRLAGISHFWLEMLIFFILWVSPFTLRIFRFNSFWFAIRLSFKVHILFGVLIFGFNRTPLLRVWRSLWTWFINPTELLNVSYKLWIPGE